MPELIPAVPGTPEWLAARRQGITATDIVTILGLSSWNSPYSLFWQKLGQVPETPDSDRFRLGRELEPYACERWHEATGLWAVPAGLYRHSDRAWQMATPDRVRYDGSGEEVISEVVELKTWADADRHSWADAPPAAVRAQVLWQMDVMDVAAGHVGVVFLPSGEFRSYVIEHPDDHVGAEFELVDAESSCEICPDILLMRAAGEEFMQRLRLELPAPDPDASAATLAAVRARFAKAPDKTIEVSAAIWDQWEDAKFDLGIAQGALREAEIWLREQMGEANVITVDGQPVARRITGDAQVKAHVRHSDYLRRIAPKEESCE